MNLNVEKILIIGLGMIGSSIALASKSKGIKVYGFDKSNNSIKEALEKNIIDSKVESILDINSKDFVKKVDLIIVAVPPKQTLDVLNDLKNIWNTDVTITDTSSVKKSH
jgi:prephenate dehydrogenase